LTKGLPPECKGGKRIDEDLQGVETVYPDRPFADHWQKGRAKKKGVLGVGRSRGQPKKSTGGKKKGKKAGSRLALTVVQGEGMSKKRSGGKNETKQTTPRETRAEEGTSREKQGLRPGVQAGKIWGKNKVGIQPGKDERKRYVGDGKLG